MTHAPPSHAESQVLSSGCRWGGPSPHKWRSQVKNNKTQRKWREIVIYIYRFVENAKRTFDCIRYKRARARARVNKCSWNAHVRKSGQLDPFACSIHMHNFNWVCGVHSKLDITICDGKWFRTIASANTNFVRLPLWMRQLSYWAQPFSVSFNWPVKSLWKWQKCQKNSPKSPNASRRQPKPDRTLQSLQKALKAGRRH